MLPRHHMLRDLNLVLEYKGEASSATRVPVVPGVCNARGAVQAGVLATMVDIASGSLAARAVYPDLAVTGDLRIYTSQPAEAGEVTAVSSVLRIGRAAVVVETEIMAETTEASISIGAGVATFYRLSRRDGNVKRVKDVISRQVTAFRSEGPGLFKHFPDRAGLRIIDEAAGVVELDMSEYVRNYIGALEGGMTAVLADVAGQQASCSVARWPYATCPRDGWARSIPGQRCFEQLWTAY